MTTRCITQATLATERSGDAGLSGPLTVRLVWFVAVVVLVWLGLGAVTARASLSSSGPFAIDSGHVMVGIACPSSSLCTAVDHDGGEVTFDPASPAGATRVQISAVATGSRARPRPSARS